MNTSTTQPRPHSAQPPFSPQIDWRSTKSETVRAFLSTYLGTLFFTGLLVAILPIPFLAVGDGIRILSTESNPITFGAFLTGVIALVGLYYLIEFDNEHLFEEEPGEAVQNLLTLVILAVGIMNVEWEFLAHLPYEARNLNLSDDHPPLGMLLATLLEPSVLILLVSTTLVFSICLIARESLALSPISFRRISRVIAKDLNKQKLVLENYRAAIPRFEQVGFRPHPHHLLTKGWFSKGFLVLSPIFWAILTALALCSIGIFSEPQKWPFEALPSFSYSWLLTALIPAWFFIQSAGFVHKRYWASCGHLISRSESIALVGLAILFTFPFMVLSIALGPEAAFASVLVLLIRLFIHIRQIRLIKRLLPN
ncbi:hypothetical protein [Corynebacterium sp. HMSC036E10]|uniref:hypothetical protein n=1 Tax=Corynebacterium sp. HMSC036E10 TaxID=1715215 RepID=UPI00114CB0D4|nr:hypothetical protein [Corynebacterium sp. HMSC036E10]